MGSDNNSIASNDETKVLIIGTGQFGTALAQSTSLAVFLGRKKSFSPSTLVTANVEVVHVSATSLLLDQSVDEIADVFANTRYVMYCGSRLSQHSPKIAAAMIKAKFLSNSELLIDFIDWSNPDPAIDHNEDIKGAVTLTHFLDLADSDSGTESQRWKVWKATGVSSLDVAGHQGKVNVTMYGGSSNPSLRSEIPALQIPGIVWKLPQQSSLLDEVYDRLITRSEVDRWYDAFLLSIAIFIYAFGYAYTRYSEHVNGGYPNTMMPLYVADKGISWVALWMLVVCPFAGNILTMGAAIKKNWSATTILDRLLVALFAVVTLIPLVLFFIPWGLWCALRTMFFKGHQFYSKSIYERQDNKAGNSILKASLIDIVSLKHEAGVVGYFWAFAHSIIGCIIADDSYKGKWFDKKGRLYGNNEISLALGVVGFTLITAVMIRSLAGSDSWMKLKPMYRVAAPLGTLMATLHVVFMGYKGWNKLFDYNTKKGQPSITFMSTMFPLGVLLVNLGLAMFGTKKRAGGRKIWKHSATNAAHSKYEKIVLEFVTKGGVDNTVSTMYDGTIRDSHGTMHSDPILATESFEGFLKVIHAEEDSKSFGEPV